MNKKTKKAAMISVEGNLCFWINNGAVVKNLKDLSEELKKISEETFKHHVSSDKNDFSSWISDVLKDDVLAKKLRKVKTLKSTVKAIEDRLKKYA